MENKKKKYIDQMEKNAEEGKPSLHYTEITEKRIEMYNARMDQLKGQIGKEDSWNKQNTARKRAKNQLMRARISGQIKR